MTVRLDLEYRCEQPAPTEPGWYYARYEGVAAIFPAHVQNAVVCGEHVGLRIRILDVLMTVDQLTWFGPVREMREG
jgi:hypothetical protein